MKKIGSLFIILMIVFSIPGVRSESVNACYESLIENRYGYLDEIELAQIDPALLEMDQDGVIYYGNRLLYYPEGLTAEQYVIPDHIAVIGTGAFSRNYCLKEVNLNNVLIVEDAAFELCINLCRITFSPYLYHIGDAAFLGCRELDAVVLPDSIRFIGAQAFCESGLQGQVDLPYELAFLGDEAFAKTAVDSFRIKGSDFVAGKWIVTWKSDEKPFVIVIPREYNLYFETACYIAAYSSGPDTVFIEADE